MSFTRALRPLAASLRTARPSASLVPHSRLTLSPAFTPPAARAFSAGIARLDRYADPSISKDPKWRSGARAEYGEVKGLSDSPNDAVLIIDVREPNEVALGSIPSSVNLPLSEFEKAIRLDEGDFVKHYGFRKPTKQQGVITLCKAGVRAQTAVDLLKSAGYKWVRNYEGSYNDWQRHEQQNPNADD
ncbi:hypothetical protein JCM10213_009196 [Rhodosporidiobolus nylandii]